jgi:hypothetical protein
MEAGIRCGGGRPCLGGFYSTQATWRCGGGEVVWRSAVVVTSMYRLRKWRGAGRRGESLPEGEEEEASSSRLKCCMMQWWWLAGRRRCLVWR